MVKEAIVCVDDESIILMAMKAELRIAFGDKYIYEQATNARTGLEIIKDLADEGITVNLIITDYLMPGIKGDEFLLKVKELYPGIVSIMMTGHADEDVVDKLKKNGVICRLLRKPWHAHELKKAVTSCIE